MRALVCEGGGFRTTFTAGVLDAWIVNNYYPFDILIGVSGGAIMLSSYLAKQYKRGFNMSTQLQKHPQLTSFERYFRGGDFLAIDVLEDMWERVIPFDLEVAHNSTKQCHVEFVCTDINSGASVYLRPDINNWQLAVKASSTLPIVTTKTHLFNNQELIDGVFANPIPLQRAIDLGATDITIVRTSPEGLGEESVLSRKVANYMLRSHPALQELLQQESAFYKTAEQIIQHPPKGVRTHGIRPIKVLKSGRLSTSTANLRSDYQMGLELGLDYLYKMQQESIIAPLQ
jgi:predicted patatin/cPLA2 family phospholipase